MFIVEKAIVVLAIKAELSQTVETNQILVSRDVPVIAGRGAG